MEHKWVSGQRLWYLSRRWNKKYNLHQLLLTFNTTSRSTSKADKRVWIMNHEMLQHLFPVLHFCNYLIPQKGGVVVTNGGSEAGAKIWFLFKTPFDEATGALIKVDTSRFFFFSIPPSKRRAFNQPQIGRLNFWGSLPCKIFGKQFRKYQIGAPSIRVMINVGCPAFTRSKIWI